MSEYILESVPGFWIDSVQVHSSLGANISLKACWVWEARDVYTNKIKTQFLSTHYHYRYHPISPLRSSAHDDVVRRTSHHLSAAQGHQASDPKLPLLQLCFRLCSLAQCPLPSFFHALFLPHTCCFHGFSSSLQFRFLFFLRLLLYFSFSVTKVGLFDSFFYYYNDTPFFSFFLFIKVARLWNNVITCCGCDFFFIFFYFFFVT